MPRTAIMADSNCGIMPAEESNYGIHILPMPIIIDGKTYFEGIDITIGGILSKTDLRFCHYDIPAVSRGCG